MHHGIQQPQATPALVSSRSHRASLALHLVVAIAIEHGCKQTVKVTTTAFSKLARAFGQL